MSSASAPLIVPSPQPVPAPGSPPATTKRPKRSWLWVLALVAALAGGAAWWMNGAAETTGSGAAAGPVAVKTATVWKGPVVATIRVSGTTGAEKFASLLTPQLRGSRGGSGRDGSMRGGSGRSSGGSSVSSNSSSSGSGSSSSSSSSSSGSGTVQSSSAVAGAGSVGSGGGGSSDGTSVASTSGTSAMTGGSASAMRSATSRVPRAGGNERRATSGRSGNSALSPSVGADGLGSTSSQLSGGSQGPGSIGGMSSGGRGGGGGGGDFGLVLQDLVKPGSMVKKGQKVAEFDRQNMLIRLEDYRASVAQIEASVVKLKAELDISRKAHQQTIASAKAALEKAQLDMKTLPVLGTIDAERTKLALEEAQARYKQLLSEVKFVEIGYQSQIKSAEIELQQARIELKRSEANVDKMVLKAPIEGLTVMQSIWRGGEMAQIGEGDQLYPGMMFMQIVDPRSMIINAVVNQVDVEKLRIGAKATVRFDAYPGLELPARLYSIGAMTKQGGARASFVKEVPVLLKLEQMDARVIPDLSVSAEIAVAREDAEAVAPRSAIFRDASGKPFVHVKEGDGWQQRRVETGLGNHTSIAIRGGLKSGEVVATEPPPAQTAGARTRAALSPPPRNRRVPA